jgi:hypothetical protein
MKLVILESNFRLLVSVMSWINTRKILFIKQWPKVCVAIVSWGYLYFQSSLI